MYAPLCALRTYLRAVWWSHLELGEGCRLEDIYIYIYIYIYTYIYIYIHIFVCMYVCLVAWCNSNPMAASGAHTTEVPSVAGNTQADDTLPSIVGRGGANGRITPGPHTQLFGGARHPPPPTGTPGTAPPEPPSPAPLLDPPLQAPPPPRGLRPTVSWGGSWRPGPRGRPPPWHLPS